MNRITTQSLRGEGKYNGNKFLPPGRGRARVGVKWKFFTILGKGKRISFFEIAGEEGPT
jgi:hypothetical protein